MEAYKQKKLKLQIEAKVNPAYTMTEVLNRMKKEIPLSLQDLRTEINQLKNEITQLKRRIEILELDNPNQEEEEEDLEDIKLFEESDFCVGESSKKEINEYLNIIEQTIPRRYVIKIKLVINQEFTLETLALIDTGTNRNCIREGLIPTRY